MDRTLIMSEVKAETALICLTSDSNGNRDKVS